MVNKNFYSVINSLVDRAVVGRITEIVDYNTFVDAGKQLTALQINELQNGFLNSLMNKVSLTIDTYRGYEPAFNDMYKGTTNGGVIELLVHHFYEAKQAPFIDLQDTDNDNAFVIAKPKLEARYYTDEVAYQIPITRSDTELRAAWKSPEAMDSFITSIFGDVSNSINYEKEVSRINAVCSMVADVMGKIKDETINPASSSDNAEQVYKLVTLYNQEKAPGKNDVTSENALQDKDFVRWMVATIRKVGKLAEKPTAKFNLARIKTFTPKREQKLKLLSKVDSAIRVSQITAYNDKYGALDEYEVLPFWQNIDDPSAITEQGGTGQRITGVVAVLYDTYALGEFVNMENVTSMYNGRKLYTTYYYNGIRRYIRNHNANFIVFTLE